MDETVENFVKRFEDSAREHEDAANSCDASPEVVASIRRLAEINRECADIAKEALVEA